jgi:hypothetical protein
MKKFGIYYQWRSELFLVGILSREKGTRSAPRLLNLREEHLTGVRIFFIRRWPFFHNCQNKDALGN